MNSPVNNELFTETPCRTLDELLRYRDGTLNTEERHRVEEHLLDCPLCSDALEGLTRLQSNDAIEQIRTAIHQPEQNKGLPPFGKYIAIAASLSAIVLLSWFAYNQFNSVGTERLAVRSADGKSAETMVAPAIEEPVVPSDTVIATVVEGQKQDAVKQTESRSLMARSMQPIEVQEDEMAVLNEAQAEEVSMPDEEFTSAVAEGDAVMNKPTSVASGAVFLEEKKLEVASLHGLKIVSYEYGTVIQEEKSNVAKRQKSAGKEDAVPSATIATQHVNDYPALIGPPLLLYKKGQYMEAIAGFDRILKNHPNDQNARYYKGMCYHHLNDYNHSINLLTPLANDPDNIFMEDAMFYLAQSYANTGNRIPAVNLYNNIIQNNSNFTKQAKEELIKIEGGK